MMRKIFVTGLLLFGSTIHNAASAEQVNAANEVKDNNEKHLRGAAEENQGEERELKPRSDYGARLRLYQMDTSRATAGEWSTKDFEHAGFSASTQPFYKPIPNGATGELIYRASGWTLLYTFAARGLQADQPYTLIYNPNSDNPAADIVCLGSNTVGRLGTFFLADNLELDFNLPKAVDRNKGAKMWLVPSGDINCDGATKIMTTQPNYNRYMFSRENEFLKFDNLGY